MSDIADRKHHGDIYYGLFAPLIEKLIKDAESSQNKTKTKEEKKEAEDKKNAIILEFNNKYQALLSMFTQDATNVENVLLSLKNKSFVKSPELEKKKPEENKLPKELLDGSEKFYQMFLDNFKVSFDNKDPQSGVENLNVFKKNLQHIFDTAKDSPEKNILQKLINQLSSLYDSLDTNVVKKSYLKNGYEEAAIDLQLFENQILLADESFVDVLQSFFRWIFGISNPRNTDGLKHALNSLIKYTTRDPENLNPVVLLQRKASLDLAIKNFAYENKDISKSSQFVDFVKKINETYKSFQENKNQFIKPETLAKTFRGVYGFVNKAKEGLKKLSDKKSDEHKISLLIYEMNVLEEERKFCISKNQEMMLVIENQISKKQAIINECETLILAMEAALQNSERSKDADLEIRGVIEKLKNLKARTQADIDNLRTFKSTFINQNLVLDQEVSFVEKLVSSKNLVFFSKNPDSSSPLIKYIKKFCNVNETKKITPATKTEKEKTEITYKLDDDYEKQIAAYRLNNSKNTIAQDIESALKKLKRKEPGIEDFKAMLEREKINILSRCQKIYPMMTLRNMDNILLVRVKGFEKVEEYVKENYRPIKHALDEIRFGKIKEPIHSSPAVESPISVEV